MSQCRYVDPVTFLDGKYDSHLLSDVNCVYGHRYLNFVITYPQIERTLRHTSVAYFEKLKFL